MLPSPGSVLGENGDRVGDWATEDVQNQHISRPLVSFQFAVVLGWKLSLFRSTAGKRVSYLFISSLFGVSSTNSPPFNLQIAVQIQVSPLSTCALGDPTDTSYLSESQ